MKEGSRFCKCKKGYGGKLCTLTCEKFNYCGENGILKII